MTSSSRPEVAELTQALGEAAVEIRVWMKSAEGRLALRGPRGDPRRGGHVDREVLPADRHARPALATLAGQGRVRGTGEAAVPAPGSLGGGGGGGGQAGQQARAGASGVGERKVWAMVRHDGHVISEATVLRLLRDDGLILPAAYQRERRQLAERRKARSPSSRLGRTRYGS